MINIELPTEISGNNHTYEKHKGPKRNIWNEKKNSLLVEFVKQSKYPTPWRPKHGTNKEIWQDIADKIRERPDVFETPVHWEAAKEQLNKIIERQKLRRSAGDYSTKTETELFVDEMIKHIQAEDEERHNLMRKQQERAHKRSQRRVSSDGGLEDDKYDDDDYSVVDVGSKKTRLSNMSNSNMLSATSSILAPASASSSSSTSASATPSLFATLPHLSSVNSSSGNNNNSNPLNSNNLVAIEAYLLEREKSRYEAELGKERERMEREKERDVMSQKRDELLLKMVQEQLVASQSMLHAATSLMNQLANKLETLNNNSTEGNISSNNASSSKDSV